MSVLTESKALEADDLETESELTTTNTERRLSLPANGKSSLDERNKAPRPSPQQIRRLSQRARKFSERRKSRSSLLPDLGSAAARRRTYNVPVYSQAPSTDAKATSRFSTASFASLQTLETYCTATSSVGSWHTALSVLDDDPSQSHGSLIRRTFRKLLQLNGVPSLVEGEEYMYDEYDWCGRGMHVDFAPSEKVPLEVCDSAGHGSTSSVDVVKCRRIKLARKLTRLTHRTDYKVLLKEVQALQRLRHAHVVQLIGTYRHGRKFAALLYPVADMDLAEYLEEARYMSDANEDFATSKNERGYQDVLSKGSLCLMSALRYVHESGVKHMDIKPANVLLKKYKPAEAYSNNIAYKFYLCDFGIAQVQHPDERSQTETYPGKTPMYASPEVAAFETHGRASDIFSLGCVFLEMATVYSGLTVESLKMHIKKLDLDSNCYHANLDRVRSWISTLDDMEVKNKVILQMLQECAEDRPTLVRQGGTKVFDLECLHHHDPPDLFEEEEEASHDQTAPLSPVRGASLNFPAITAPQDGKDSPSTELVPNSSSRLPQMGKENRFISALQVLRDGASEREIHV